MTERHFHALNDPFAVELAGTRLLEAGAGTGKTWTIAALVLRLLLEKQLDISEIQVVTYTRAATGELRGRIRARLSEALAAFEAGAAAELFLQTLIERHEAHDAAARLRLAIESFDAAAIHTIHGFCQRALAETAFAAGQLFDRELVADQGEIVAAVARDYWRQLMAAATAGDERLWAAWLVARLAGPDGLVAPIRSHLGRLDARLAAPAAEDRQAVASHYRATFAQARAIWRQDRDAILAWVGKAKLRGNMWPASKIASRALLADQVFAQALPPLSWPAEMERWGGTWMEKARTQSSPPADHFFFAAVDALVQAADGMQATFERATRSLLHDFLQAARAQLAERKRRAGLQSYDDLLADLAAALQGPQGSVLATQMRQRCRAVLVDEFQDTDPLQLAIFFGAFGVEGHPLIFVGDPKQAIYGFRGADVFAYLAARSRATAGYALLENRRSDPPLLTAVNALFARPLPFLLADLPFEAALPAQMARAECRIEDELAPLSLWMMEAPAGTKGFPKEPATAAVVDAVAGDIHRLLSLAASGKASVSGRALCSGDIAVLVRKRSQGEAIRQALARHGIASVAMGGGSIWQTEEAEELERLLLAIAAPARTGLVRAALCTRLLGRDAAALVALAEDGEAWVECLRQFHDDQLEFRTRGFMAMWLRLLRREHVVARILQTIGGERRLTNYRHLAELLQAVEHAGGLDIEGLARHLARQRENGSASEDENQLRLESDARLVRIVTIHAAKGLQYPVVYCPFLWDGPQPNSNGWPVLAHELAHELDGGGDSHACLDFGSADIDRRRASADLEAAAEELRLAYVALTRAQHRCVIAWGKVNHCERSPLAWLLFASREAGQVDEADPRRHLVERLGKLDAADLRAEMDALAGSLGGAMAVLALPTPTSANHLPAMADGSAKLAAREFVGTIPSPWPILSFSSLAAQAGESEQPDRDAAGGMAHAVLPFPEKGFPAVTPIFSGQPVKNNCDRFLDFPRGTRAGSCLHALLERVDFRNPDANLQISEAALAEFGFDPAWRDVLARMVGDVVATPLNRDDLVLGQVARAARIVEMEFNFPLGSAAQRAGYMKGFIDLVFRHGGRWYIVDYKSNWLGDRPEDYALPRLAEAMRAHRYDLQLRIYAAALKRALAVREPALDFAEHFGGVFYLFLRGMAPGSSNGVYFARPTASEIENFTREVVE